MILALDIGTSSIRGALYDEHAEPVAGTAIKIPSQLITDPTGRATIDADLAVERVADVVDAVLHQGRGADGDIECVAVCAFWHSLLGLDSHGRPTTDVLTWADTRSRQQSAELKELFDERDVHARTGAHFHSSFWPAKLMWIRDSEPRIWASTQRWVSFSDYVALRFCGTLNTSVSMAAGTGMFDIARQQWDAELSASLGLDIRKLPGPEHQNEHFALKPQYTERWPQLKNARWSPAIGDGAADSLGAGCTTRDSAALMVGTSAAMRVVSGNAMAPPSGLWCYKVDPGRAILGGALSDGGNLYESLARNLKIHAQAEDSIRKRGAAAHGINFLPFFAGERSTGYHENARGAIEGVTNSHDAVDVLQAGLEAVAYRLAEILDRLESLTPIEKIVASGGALRDSSVWPQIIADVLGRDLTISNVSESASRGAVLLALESLGKIDSIDNVPKPASTTLAFRPECHEIYKKARVQHQSFYNRTFHTNT